MRFEPLTPTAFLARSALVFGDRAAVIDGRVRFTYREFHARALKLAGALKQAGLRRGARVAVLAGNTHVALLAHYGVPLAGSVLVPLNTRASEADIDYILGHAGCSLLIHDRELSSVSRRAARRRGICMIRAGGEADELESLIAAAPPHEARVTDERGLLSLNYTSGTTARPKGVMYHHRGAYLQALAMAMHLKLDCDSAYLWTLPMFHCNGWCFTWAVTAAGAVHHCLGDLSPAAVWDRLRGADVTHLCGAPTLLARTFWDAAAEKGRTGRLIRVGTGGASPTPALLARAAQLGMEITHLYGLTETFGPAVICEWPSEWTRLPAAEQARLKARQGVGNVISGAVRCIDRRGRDVPADGQTLGEIALRGNNVMLGYYRDDKATAAAISQDWFRSGDLGVMHAGGYIEIKDRAKDIIISGGENISSVEVEQALNWHPAVLEAAVIAAPDDHWGEIPVAFVTLKENAMASEGDLIRHAREKLAHFKAPKRVIFGPLPKTATGKVQKHLLRSLVAS